MSATNDYLARALGLTREALIGVGQQMSATSNNTTTSTTADASDQKPQMIRPVTQMAERASRKMR